jgi:hypothetical protein
MYVLYTDLTTNATKILNFTNYLLVLFSNNDVPIDITAKPQIADKKNNVALVDVKLTVGHDLTKTAINQNNPATTKISPFTFVTKLLIHCSSIV